MIGTFNASRLESSCKFENRAEFVDCFLYNDMNVRTGHVRSNTLTLTNSNRGNGNKRRRLEKTKASMSTGRVSTFASWV